MSTTKHTIAVLAFSALALGASDARAGRADGVAVEDALTPRGDGAFKSNTLRFDNDCGHPLQLAVYAKYQGTWSMHAWYLFDAYEGLLTLDVQTDNRFVYFFAETTDGSNLAWRGEHRFPIPDYGEAGFIEWNTGPEPGTFTNELEC